MAKPKFVTNPTAADVRTALGLPAQRGRLSREVIAQYNKGKRANKRYVDGAGTVQRNEAKAAAKAHRAALVAKGVKVGTRGPLPKVALAQSKG